MDHTRSQMVALKNSKKDNVKFLFNIILLLKD